MALVDEKIIKKKLLVSFKKLK